MSTSTQTTSAEPATSQTNPFNAYLLVTLIATPANVIAFMVVLRATSWHPSIANATSAMALAVPTLIAYRKWVWPQTTKVSIRREVIPYLVLTALNIGAAAITLAVVDATGAPSSVVTVTPLLTYTALWIGRFVLLDWAAKRENQGALSAPS